MSERANYPTFLGIGAQKSGSTWLYNQLREHPDVWVGPQGLKEVHFFDEINGPGDEWWARQRLTSLHHATRGIVNQRKLRRRDFRHLRTLSHLAYAARDDRWYEQFYSLAPKTAIARGEITPNYSRLGPEGVEHAKRVNPALSVLFVIRHPVERAWSQLRMTMDKRRLGQLSEAECVNLALTDEYLGRGDYRTTIETWQRVFPESQFHVLLYDDLVADRQAFLTKVAGCIGVDNAKMPRLTEARGDDPRRDNMPPQLQAALAEHYRPMIDWLSAHYDIPPTWHD